MATQAFVHNAIGTTGVAESGAILRGFSQGTTTPKVFYSDSTLTVPAAASTLADAAGHLKVYYDDSTDWTFVVKSANDAATLLSVDVIGGVASITYADVPNFDGFQEAVSSFLEDLAAAGIDASWVAPLGAGYIPPVGFETTYSALRLRTVTDVPVRVLGRLSAGDGGGDAFRWASGDQSATLVLATKTVSAVDTGADELTVTAHGFQTCQGVIASAAEAGLSLNTIYYARYIDANTVSLHTTQKGAVNDTGQVNITALGGSLSLKSLRDPGEVVYVIPTGAEIDGSEGCWVRQWDKVSVTTLMAGGVVDGSTDDFEAIQHAEMFIRTTGAQLRWPYGTSKTTAGLIKSGQTVWIGMGSNQSSGGLGSKLETAFNGSAITLLGDGVNRRGAIRGIRIQNSDNATYTTADGVVTSGDVRDHITEDCYVLNYRDCYADRDGGKAHYIIRCYLTGASRYGLHLQDNTDSWVLETQSDGADYGMYFQDSVTVNVHNSRPQVSGEANVMVSGCFDFKMIGGYSDSSINGPSPTTATGITIKDTSRVQILGVNFYSNGNDAAHIRVESGDGETCTDIVINDNITTQSGSNTGTVKGVEFIVAGTGIIRRVSMAGNDLLGVDQSIVFPSSLGSATFEDIYIAGSNILLSSAAVINPNSVSNELYYEPGIGRPSYTAYASRATDLSLTAVDIGTHRFTGTQSSSINVDLPVTGNYAGKRLRIRRGSSGAGLITVRYNAATTIAVLYGVGEWIDVEATGTGATWAVIARGHTSEWTTGITFSTTPQTILAAGVEGKAWRVFAMRSSGDGDVDAAEWTIIGDGTTPVVFQNSDIVSGTDRALALSVSGTDIQLAAGSTFTGQYKIMEV
jgi:hypothetical protein